MTLLVLDKEKSDERGELVFVAMPAGGPGGTVEDATSSTKGVVKLAGDLGGTADAPTVPGLAGKAPTVHSHTIANVTGLQTIIDDIGTALGLKADAAHTHTIANVTGLQAALDGKSANGHTHSQAEITNLSTDLALKAPLASPALTGTPTVPTAAPGTNTTQAASTAFVAAALAALINAAPGLLDTLDELAAALGDDPNFAATMTTALAGKASTTHTHAQSEITGLVAALALLAPLASPALTGTPTAPTAAPGTNTTQLASTAFVAALGALKADLASPTFTGTPAAPTPTTADNTTKLATTAFVKAQGYATLASPTLTGDPKAPTPATADNDTSIATTAFVKAQGYAPLASPALTGTPTVPTAAPGTNTTQAASTAFVTAAVAGGGGGGVTLPTGVRVPLFGSKGTTVTGLQGGWMNSVMIAVEQAITIVELVLEVAGAGASPSDIHLGLFSFSTPGGLGTLVHNFGSVSSTTTGFKSLTGSWAVPAGKYYFSQLMVGNAANIRAGGTSDGIGRIIVLPGELEPGKRYLSDSGATVIPSTFTPVAPNGATASDAVAQIAVVLA